jgi:indolepyruvate ferredoxin oxidoreductase alpha subunit
MKHVGVNVAADVLFSAAYTSIPGALVVVSADDPGMASSQNEQDNRRYAIAAGVPMLEPRDSQQAYDYLALAVDIAEQWQMPVMLRMTTRVCHSKSVVRFVQSAVQRVVHAYERDVNGRVMLPAYARSAHRRLRRKLSEIAVWAESAPVVERIDRSREIGIICSGPAALHVQEAAPDASLLILGMTHPLPQRPVESFIGSIKRCMVIEEGDPVLFESLRAAGFRVDRTPPEYRFGELNVQRVRSILNGEADELPLAAKGKAPELCAGCPHRAVFDVLRKHEITVSGDIGCYTLAALPPTSGMDSVVCMGASIGIGIGMRYVLPQDRPQKLVSVIGDSTFVHSGITGLVEMVYNAPASGHVVIVLDNGTTAMTGLQEHAATGRTLAKRPAPQLSIEGVARAIGVSRVEIIDPRLEATRFESTLLQMLDSDQVSVLIARRPCVLSAARRQSESRRAAECDIHTGKPAEG